MKSPKKREEKGPNGVSGEDGLVVGSSHFPSTYLSPSQNSPSSLLFDHAAALLRQELLYLLIR